MQLTSQQRDMLAKFLLDGLRKTERADPIVRCEILLDRVDLFLQTQTEELGIANLSEPPRAGDPVEWPIQVDPFAKGRVANPALHQPPPVAPAAVTLANPSADPPGDKLIAMPGDSEFQQFDGQVDLNRVRPRRRPQTQSTRPQWDAGDLIASIEQQFPPEIEFTPHGMDKGCRVIAIRNITNMPATDLVRLEYASSRVNDGGGGVQQTEGVPTEPVVLGLTARWTFSLYDSEQNFEDALHGPRGVIEQLRGLYRPKGKRLDPNSGPEPGPLRFDMDQEPMRENYSSPVQGNWHQIDTSRTVKDAQVRDNRTMGRLVV